jgi:hypothetical protein
MHHEPSCFLTNSERPVNLPARDLILGIRDEPNSGQPLVQAKGRVFKDRTCLDRELTLRVVSAALPSLRFKADLRREVRDTLPLAAASPNRPISFSRFSTNAFFFSLM